MRNLKLRTHIAILVGTFLALFSTAAGFSYWMRSHAHVNMEKSFEKDLAFLAELPRLRGKLRQLDTYTDNYLLTGNPQWLDQRQDAIGEVVKTEKFMAQLFTSVPQQRIWEFLGKKLSLYITQQEQWIEQKRGGALAREDALQLVIADQEINELIQEFMTIRDLNVQQLQDRRHELQRASLIMFLFLTLTGLGLGIAVTVYLSQMIVFPLEELQEYAQKWELGHSWELKRAPSARELRSLFQTMEKMGRRMNQQFQKEHELSQFKTQLVSMVSHEFNNALNVIQASTFVLEETEKEGPSSRRENFYAMLKNSTKALVLMVNNLLNMGRLETGRFALDPKKTHVRDVVKEILGLTQLLSQRKGLQMALDFPPEPMPVKADPEALSLVLTNLISNAIKYTPEKGTVTVGLRPVPGDPALVRIYVKDTGIGISPADQEKIFTDFFRTEDGKRMAKGFGLGLSLVKQIIDAHHSALEVESEPGRGSTFSFTLPLHKSPAEKLVPSAV